MFKLSTALKPLCSGGSYEQCCSLTDVAYRFSEDSSIFTGTNKTHVAAH